MSAVGCAKIGADNVSIRGVMQSSLRRLLAAAIATLVLAAGLLIPPQAPLPTADAAPAEGSGQHADSIYWLDWRDAVDYDGEGSFRGRHYYRVQEGTSVTAEPVDGVEVKATSTV